MNFELVAKDFYDFAEMFCNKEDKDFVRPFENEKTVFEGIPIKDILAQYVENNPPLMEKITAMQKKNKRVFYYS